jgi:lysozyme
LNTNIRDSVGDPKEGAANRDEDVRTVQGLLNVQIVKDHRSDRFLAVDGRIGSATLGAIDEFQRRHSLPGNGLIKSGDAVMRALGSFSGPRGMRASSGLLEFMKKPRIEGYSRVLYDHDGAGNTTIGVGHFVHGGKKDPHNSSEENFKNGLTDSQVESLFWSDMSKPTSDITDHVRVPVTQNQFDAVASLVFNIGPSAFNDSRLLRLLNKGDYCGAASHFEDFRYAHHGLVKGLAERRRTEKELFLRR